MDKLNGNSSARQATNGRLDAPKAQVGNDRSAISVKEKVDRILESLEKSPMAERLELLQFLMSSVASGAGDASSAGSTNYDSATESTRLAMHALAAEKESPEKLRSMLLMTLRSSLPGYVNSKLDSLVTWVNPDAARLAMVKTMRDAQVAGFKAMGHFSQHDNKTKLKLLGFSHSKCYLGELGKLVTQYEHHKKQYLYPKEVGFAYKDGFNEALIEQLPENQKARFKEIMTEADYPTKRDLLEAAIEEFLKGLALAEAHAGKAPGATGTETTTTTTTGTDGDVALLVTTTAASSTTATTATAPITTKTSPRSDFTTGTGLPDASDMGVMKREEKSPEAHSGRRLESEAMLKDEIIKVLDAMITPEKNDPASIPESPPLASPTSVASVASVDTPSAVDASSIDSASASAVSPDAAVETAARTPEDTPQ